MINSNTIYNMDCIEMLRKADDKSISGVITSPPYNILGGSGRDLSGESGTVVGYDDYDDNMTNDEYRAWMIEIFVELDRKIAKNGKVVWNLSYGTNNSELMSLFVADVITHTNFTLADIIVWKKDNAIPNNVSHNRLTRICEFVYIFVRKDEIKTFETNKKMLYKSSGGQNIYDNVFNYINAKNNDGSNDLNKATYSTELVTKLLKMYFKPGELVCDPFMGTGTTAISCINYGCDFVGSEISSKQVDHTNERINKAYGNVGLFA